MDPGENDDFLPGPYKSDDHVTGVPNSPPINGGTSPAHSCLEKSRLISTSIQSYLDLPGDPVTTPDPLLARLNTVC